MGESATQKPRDSKVCLNCRKFLKDFGTLLFTGIIAAATVTNVTQIVIQTKQRTELHRPVVTIQGPRRINSDTSLLVKNIGVLPAFRTHIQIEIYGSSGEPPVLLRTIPSAIDYLDQSDAKSIRVKFPDVSNYRHVFLAVCWPYSNSESEVGDNRSQFDFYISDKNLIEWSYGSLSRTPQSFLGEVHYNFLERRKKDLRKEVESYL